MESLDRIKCVFKMSDWKPITCYCDHNSSHSKDFNKNKNFNIRNREKSCFRSTGFLLIKTMFILKIIVCLLAYNCRALSHSSSGKWLIVFLCYKSFILQLYSILKFNYCQFKYFSYNFLKLTIEKLFNKLIFRQIIKMFVSIFKLLVLRLKSEKKSYY